MFKFLSRTLLHSAPSCSCTAPQHFMHGHGLEQRQHQAVLLLMHRQICKSTAQFLQMHIRKSTAQSLPFHLQNFHWETRDTLRKPGLVAALSLYNAAPQHHRQAFHTILLVHIPCVFP